MRLHDPLPAPSVFSPLNPRSCIPKYRRPTTRLPSTFQTYSATTTKHQSKKHNEPIRFSKSGYNHGSPLVPTPRLGHPLLYQPLSPAKHTLESNNYIFPHRFRVSKVLPVAAYGHQQAHRYPRPTASTTTHAVPKPRTRIWSNSGHNAPA